MKILSITQGSPEWVSARAKCFCASDAPAMMSCSPYKTRSELLREKHFGFSPDVDAGTQKRFDDGHRFEAMARPLAEALIGQDLYPVVCVSDDGRYLASMDGLTLGEEIAFEHKTAGAELRAALTSEDCGKDLPLHYRVQMEHQLMVASSAERVLFMATLWDGDVCTFSRHCWYEPDAELRAQILRAWDQFEKDLAEFSPTPAAEPVVIAPLESLPAVAVRMDGALVVQSNLPAFGEALRAFVDRVPKRPSTDVEFAETEAACKALKRAEEALDAAEANALASLADVNAMRRMVSDFRELARTTRLASEKMVDRRKAEVKEDAVIAARRTLDAHIATLNAELAPFGIRPPVADFAGAIKGRRTMASMQDALDGVLAVAKIASDEDARALRANLATFKDKAGGFEFLFADLGQFLHKAADDFGALLVARIETHKAAELVRENQRREAERMRSEEAARQAAAAVQVAAQVPAVTAAQFAPQPQRQLLPVHNPAPKAEEPATLNLGTICGRLGFTVSAAFLADVLHIQPARSDKAARFYTETQFGTICRQLQSHVSAMAELYCG